MVVKEYNYAGSSALDPKRQHNNPKRKVRIKDKRRNNPKRKKKTFLQMVGAIISNEVTYIALAIVVCGFITVTRDGKIYSIQKQLSEINKDIKVLVSENEALSIELLKASSLDKIENVAKNKLNMINPTKEQMVGIGE